MGATEYYNGTKPNTISTMRIDDDEDDRVEAAPASIVVYYFLKSHGGAHVLQCFCSLLATGAGFFDWKVRTESVAPATEFVVGRAQACQRRTGVVHVGGQSHS